MVDFAAARRMMVDGQVRTSDVTDHRIIGAMLELPRERFVAEVHAKLAYFDIDVPATTATRTGRRLLKPMVLAKMVQAAQIGEDDLVLEVGCATGYSTAVLARLARAVAALEEDEALVQTADANLRALGFANVTVVGGPLTEGWAPRAPYDAIFVNGAVEFVPRALCGQLAEGGRMAAVVGRAPISRAMLYRCVGGDVSGWPIFDAAAPLLPGFAVPPAFVF
jgi:protein-L-isoaspartate(D-aspartate) O-methyltransferase